MKRRTWAGELLLACGVLHTLVGLALGWPALAEVLDRGVLNSAYQVDLRALPGYAYRDWVRGFLVDGGDVPRVLWFLWSGIPWMMLGYWGRRVERDTGASLPEWLGWSLLAYAAGGLVALPLSGFWLVASASIYAIVVARRASASEAARLLGAS
jgi:hypothetical protein